MERFTFADPGVAAQLAKLTLLQADVTANSDDDKALLRRFELFGPPGIIFFDGQGREVPGARVVGFQDAAAFIDSIGRATRSPGSAQSGVAGDHTLTGSGKPGGAAPAS
jgi:thiol:disulfide interchange protein DsbD